MTQIADTASAGAAPPSGPGPLARFALFELLLTGLEVVLCGVPLLLLAGYLGVASLFVRGAVPLGLALWLVCGLRVFDLLRPVVAVAAARRSSQPIAPTDASEAQRALDRLPRESAIHRMILWPVLALLLAWLADRHAPGQRAFVLAALVVTIMHAVGVASLRGLAFDRLAGASRTTWPGGIDSLALFGSHFRFRLIAASGLVLGFTYAGLALMSFAFADMPGIARAQAAVLLASMILLGTPVWWHLLRHRARPIDGYLEAATHAGDARGPGREDPRGPAAFVAAQAIPYWLAGAQAFIVVLAGVIAVAAGRFRAQGAYDVAVAARLLGIVGVGALLGLLVQPLVLRQILGPFMRMVGSRHHLPAVQVRARIGFAPKLIILAVGATVVGCGFLALRLHAPPAAAGLATPVLLVGWLMIVLLVALSVREFVAPLAALESRSEELSRGELARPIAPSGEADEIGRLTVVFEEMRRSLRDRLRSTESINVDLEREVRRRTEALERANGELRDALDKLRRAQDNLVRSEKLASMGRLVAGIAHEINNPVNAVINSLGPLENTVARLLGSADAEAAGAARAASEMLSVVQRGAARTKAIVQALHNYSRGDEAVEREIDLGRSVNDTLDLLRHRLGNLTIDRQIDSDVRVQGFAGQIDQVLMNLITNAAQALGDRGRIRIGVTALADAIEIVVADDGPGIPADVLPHIFDPFFTTKPVGEGSGLGLSIVHGIIERHGGSIDVDSAAGRGTTFRILLPRQRAAAASRHA